MFNIADTDADMDMTRTRVSTDLCLAVKAFFDCEIQVIIFSTQKLMMYTEWNGKPAASLDEYIDEYSKIDPATCKTDCLKDVSKICPKDVDGEEMLTVFFKCPSWETAPGPAYYCQQQLEGRFFNHSKLKVLGFAYILYVLCLTN